MKYRFYRNQIGIGIVTPFAGVWIEIQRWMGGNVGSTSLPSRECGLKLDDDMIAGTGELSLPSRECGLK